MTRTDQECWTCGKTIGRGPPGLYFYSNKCKEEASPKSTLRVDGRIIIGIFYIIGTPLMLVFLGIIGGVISGLTISEIIPLTVGAMILGVIIGTIVTFLIITGREKYLPSGCDGCE